MDRHFVGAAGRQGNVGGRRRDAIWRNAATTLGDSASRRPRLRLKGVVARLSHRGVCYWVRCAKLGQPFYGPANRQLPAP